ncbi:MAG: substrate-binding domain-containing protein, partial [Acutalibacteraceae bacterium]|nr:substrate-binding domain-containing protein [Acutalibacteraceae bacterium]
GFLDVLKDHPEFEVVVTLDSMGNQLLGNENATDALTAHPNAVCIFGGIDPTALGAAAAIDAAGSKALLYGVDGSPDVKALIAEGRATGTGAQSPISIGKTIAEKYYEWKDGAELEDRYPIPTFMINSDNIADYNNGGWQ